MSKMSFDRIFEARPHEGMSGAADEKFRGGNELHETVMHKIVAKFYRREMGGWKSAS